MPADIDARPTKTLFIANLTHDIPLTAAINDLVDNSIDGARSLRPDARFSGLSVRITATPTEFRIADNCGGMTLDLAKHYAFRFGRSADAPKTPHSIGRFGVGMKRALFKLGRHFRIDSRTLSSRFVVEVDVPQWEATDAWTFDFATVEDNVAQPSTGTDIIVTEVDADVAAQFRLPTFLGQLLREVAAKQVESISHDLAIIINGVPAGMQPMELLASNQLRPAFVEQDLTTPAGVLRARYYAGIAGSEPREAGWYVFCNGRLVLQADQSSTTGWGEESPRVPRFHNQYARFRGYVFLDGDEPAALPWNTTKTALDPDAPSYLAIRTAMVRLMRPVIDFLNDLDADPTLEDVVAAATSSRFTLAASAPSFTAPSRTAIQGPRLGRVQYSKPVDEIVKAMRSLGVTTYKDVGEKTFEYYLRQEGL